MEKNNSSYKQIIKSTSIFGGSQFITVIIGIIRTKIVALLLGPMGVGIIGIYQSVIDMIRSVSSLGIDTAAIKEIASADTDQLNKTISVFNRWFLAIAGLGFLACIAFSYPISLWAFEDASHTIPIALLSVCVFLTILTIGRSVALQGMRKISYMAQAAVWGSFIGLIVTIPVYYFTGLEGIVTAFIISSLILYFCTDFYYRKIGIKKLSISNKEAFNGGLSTLKLGLFIVVAGIINTAAMFLVRTFLAREINVDEAGLFQSAWSISNVYLGLILKSMGTDFYPRLSAIINDGEKAKKLVNEQSYIVLIVATPLIIGMLLFSNFALSILYSSKFTEAYALLQWQVIASFFKVLTWPLAFIMLAKNKGALFLLSEAIFYIVYLLSSYIYFPYIGLTATGVGYLIAYLAYVPVMIIICRKIADFSWNKNILYMIGINLSLIVGAFFITQTIYIYLIGGAILLTSLVYSYIKLKQVFSLDDLKKWFERKK